MKQIVRIIIFTFGLFFVILGSGCSRNTHKIKVVKPKKHFGWFDSKKDRKKKRTKVVTYKVHRGIKY